jgi:mono/diheme cytochrome c family protein
MSLRRLLPLLAPALFALPVRGTEPATADPPDKVDFNRDIRPIFADACYQCHGPDKGHRKAGLRLDTREGIFGKRESIVAGKPQMSELYLRLVSDDPAERMPQAAANKTLTGKQIALVKKWIEQGAEFKGHWAYVKPSRPAVPAAEEPGFVRNPVDRFVLDGLKKVDLEHAPEADRVTLIRRLSFDLTGLPPTRAEVDAYLADRSPDAYEKVVDRLLASPHYGERMAMYWLDLVRYADSIGYHSDNPMNVSPYRDHVIRVFNDNQRFDRFTVEQLAGDLLPGSTLEQKVASGYNRLLQTTAEGGAQPNEYIAKYAADRVRNVSTVWLGSTMGCCQCHDHKFDPFSMRDFYSMAAFFADIREPAVGLREGGLPVPNAAETAEMKKIQDDLVAAKTRLAVPVTLEMAAEQALWERQLHERPPAISWTVLDPDTATATGSLALVRQPNGVLKVTGVPPDRGAYTITSHVGQSVITGVRLEVLPDSDLPGKASGLGPDGDFVLSEIRVRAGSRPVRVVRARADFSRQNYPVGDAIDDNPVTGWAIGPAVGVPHAAVFEFDAPLSDSENELTIELEHQSKLARHWIGRFRLSVTADTNPAGPLELPSNVAAALALPRQKRSPAEQRAVTAFYRTVAPRFAPVRAQIAEVERCQKALNNTIAKCLVSVAGTPRTMRVLARGNWLDTTGEVVLPATPRALPDFGAEARSKERLTRLDLANWIVSPENPLTARVFVNRLWKLYFGQGLTRTLDDVGAQGDWPTHPELLDWLGVEFVASDWNVKAIVRMLVTSGTYRQSAQPSARQKEIDPFNRYLGRQMRYRLDAEVVRDNALAVSGLLNPQVGGRSVFPYQPAGYWSALNFPPREWHDDSGSKLYRRGMYTHWQRSFPQPSLLAFDAPGREECTVERSRSNIPQQALVLLNDPTFVEAARAFAERVVKEGGSEPAERATLGFAEVLSRPPTPDELQVLTDLYARHRAQYAADREAALKLLHTGDHPLPPEVDPVELAAWTSVARVLLNLHETITRP